ncbi:MAG: DNA-directed RNA polymerase subunit beta' [Candidatus Kerfeldbacteria bacterium]|nr:DNA-directed RNA polymerase subunit beta' [Candidatus Kerfeldbacteria bacterium]
MAIEHSSPFAEFDSIRLKLASPDDIHRWSHGEVTKPETINYRTQKPERDGLFCERIFGPSKDWECYCGKYKRIRYKGIVCDKCGVEVTRSLVRRERMGHIDLAVPVSHIWFLRGVPSKIGLLLDLSVQSLEKVMYFASFIITGVYDNLREQTLHQIDEELAQKKKQIDQEFSANVSEIKKNFASDMAKATSDKDKAEFEKRMDKEIVNLAVDKDEQVRDLHDAVDIARKELQELHPLQIISDTKYHDLSLKYGHVFEAGIGAETIRKLLLQIDLEKLENDVQEEIQKSSKNKKRRLIRRLKLVRNLRVNGIRPEWMVISAIPVIPPDLRPMVQLDGGRFAASDLNDLYRRVINRNNRLKRLQELNAPEVIKRNEKRMLQEAVDALIDNNARHGKTVTASTGQKRQLKSLADMLKGKQGRFRQNLLGKRVDYSGRSVIVVGPHLKFNQCGLPKRMALELFKPFVISELIKREYVHNVRSASRFIESGRSEVWDILEEVTKHSHVLLNRAPTLHRLGIQAFQPILIEGKAIQIHPMVCVAFNADFDGDQMAVHVPLTERAKWEAANIMASRVNLLKPATGDPVVSPQQDIVLGCYYLTNMHEATEGKIRTYSSADEARYAHHYGMVHLQDEIRVRVDGKMMNTSVGRLIFNESLPKDLPYINEKLDVQKLRDLIKSYLSTHTNEQTVELLDALKNLAFHYLTQSGISWGMDDTPVPEEKYALIEAAEKEVDEIYSQYEMGLLTESERHARVVEVWARVKDKVQEAVQKRLDRYGPVFAMIDSRARGSWGQTTQMMGMKGLVTNPAGETIELPVKRSFKEGFDVLEYFISTHGARKGLTDTALRTANAGYLTRRLVDVSQDMLIAEEDCGDDEGIPVTKQEAEEIGISLAKRVWARITLQDIKAGRKTIVKKGELIMSDHLEAIKKADPDVIVIRSVLACKTGRGLCRKCYGLDLGRNALVEMGTAVGIIAAQSIGEPGTQLTMRTFHTGGVAGQDITQGLPRVEELFEARPIRKAAILSPYDGKVSVLEENRQRTIRITHSEVLQQKLKLAKGDKVKAKDKEMIGEGEIVLETTTGKKVRAEVTGRVTLGKEYVSIVSEGDQAFDIVAPIDAVLNIKDGDLVTKGQQLTEGSADLHELYKLRGRLAVQKYVMREIQFVYSSQGQPLNDKHIEIIARQMFSRFYIKDPGETSLLFGDMVTQDQLYEANKEAKENDKVPAKAENILLGITKASLSTESFLSAASFQETARVLIDAAVTGKVDRLRGLKENVIIGRVIPVGTGFNSTEMDEMMEGEKAERERDVAERARALAAEKAEIVPETIAEEEGEKESAKA